MLIKRGRRRGGGLPRTPRRLPCADLELQALAAIFEFSIIIFGNNCSGTIRAGEEEAAEE